MKITDINGVSRECLEVGADQTYPGYVKILYPSKRQQGQIRTEWYPAETFFKFNPELKDLAKAIPVPPKDITGVVSTSKPDSLKDGTQKWKLDCYIGYTVWISRGLGEGQTRGIIQNNKNTLFIDKPWDIKPDKTSQYVVSRNIHDPTPQHNILPGV